MTSMGPPQMHRADFQASDAATSFWLCQEMVKGWPCSPLLMAALGWSSNAGSGWLAGAER